MKNEKKTIVCKNCNNTIPKGVGICPSCGTKIKKPFYKQWWFILLLIFIVIASVTAISNKKGERFDWADIVLSDYLPEPKSNKGEINYNSEENLSVYIYDTSKDEYKEYMSECKTFGYTQESVIDGNSYSAFSNEGYKLSLRFDEKDEEMSISLEAPIKIDTIKWPESELAKLLPAPKSSVGAIEINSSDSLLVYVGETPIEEFENYVNACSEKGFNIDFDKRDTFYSASDMYGNKLILKYESNKVISINLDKTENETVVSTTTETTESTTENKPQASSGVSPEFKKMVDGYEAFFDEYIEFMKSFKESGNSAKMLSEYKDFMSKYAETMKALEDLENEEMNADELKYYTDAVYRINKKLMNVAQ